MALFRRGQRKPAGPVRQRWVVLDVETSGLDPARDRLLAVAAIGMEVDWTRRRLALRPGDSFEAVLRQPPAAADKPNILLHGIGIAAQQEGRDPADALAGLHLFVGEAPLLAFHAAFDRELVTRYIERYLVAPVPNAWLDIEHLCAALHAGVAARSLDEWLAHFGIECAARHEAAADVLAEAELLLRLWPRIARECGSWRDVQRLAGAQDWLRRR